MCKHDILMMISRNATVTYLALSLWFISSYLIYCRNQQLPFLQNSWYDVVGIYSPVLIISKFIMSQLLQLHKTYVRFHDYHPKWIQKIRKDNWKLWWIRGYFWSDTGGGVNRFYIFWASLSYQLGGIHGWLTAAHWIVMLTLIMACRPKNSLSELHNRKTMHIVTKTIAKFISPCLLEDRTLVRARLIPLKIKGTYVLIKSTIIQ